MLINWVTFEAFYKRGLSVCLSVQGLAAKLLNRSSPKLAWTSPWTLRMLSKNFFGG